MEHLGVYLNAATVAIISITLFLAGLAKFYDIDYTKKTIQGFDFLPTKTISALKFILPATEIAIALALLFPTSRGYATFASMLIFAVFAIALSATLFKNKNASCGCFGAVSQEKITWTTIIRATGFFISSAFLLIDFLSNQANALTTISGFAFALLGGALTIQSLFISLWRNTSKTIPAKHSQSISRRSFLKIIAITFTSIILQPNKKANALICCRCEYQRHYDPPTNCCTLSPPNYTHWHHYWKRCYNICTGQRGRWQKIQPDSCQCECGTCSDITWVEQECCYVSDCCCSMGICECGCPC